MWRAFIGTWAGIAGFLALFFQIVVLIDLWPFVLFFLVFGLFVDWSEKKLKELEKKSSKIKYTKLSKEDLENISHIIEVRPLKSIKIKKRRYKMKKLVLLVAFLVLAFTSSAFARPCIEYYGVDMDGQAAVARWCLSEDQPSIDQGIFKVDIEGGVISQSEDKGIYIFEAFGSEFDPDWGIRDIGTGFAIITDEDIYLFYSEVTDFEAINMGVGYNAFVYHIHYEYENGIFELKGWWRTIYMSVFDVLANEWIWVEPMEPIIFNLIDK